MTTTIKSIATNRTVAVRKLSHDDGLVSLRIENGSKTESMSILVSRAELVEALGAIDKPKPKTERKYVARVNGQMQGSTYKTLEGAAQWATQLQELHPWADVTVGAL